MPLTVKPAKLPDPVTAEWLATLSPFVRQAGDDIRPPWNLGRRRLLDYLAVYVDSGDGVFSLDDREYQVTPGTLFWVPPDTPHAMRGESREMHCLYLHFDLVYDPERSHWDGLVHAGTDDFGEWRGRLHPPCPAPVISGWRGVLPLAGNQLAILRGFRDICREFHAARHYPAGVSGKMLELFAAIRRGLEERSDRDARLEEAAAWLRDRMADPALEIRRAAARFGFAASHFRTRFKQLFGLSPDAWLRQCRLERARELLCYTDIPIGEIAELTGYSSIHSFSRSFRRACGMPPGGMRITGRRKVPRHDSCCAPGAPKPPA